MRRAATLFLTLTWLAALVPVLHAHHGEAPALYDEHCPLSELAASDKEIKAAPGVDLVQPSPAIELVLLPPSREDFGTCAPPFKSRGPPIAG
jgi:hypothetical protein